MRKQRQKISCFASTPFPVLPSRGCREKWSIPPASPPVCSPLHQPRGHLLFPPNWSWGQGSVAKCATWSGLLWKGFQHLPFDKSQKLQEIEHGVRLLGAGTENTSPSRRKISSHSGSSLQSEDLGSCSFALAAPWGKILFHLHSYILIKKGISISLGASPAFRSFLLELTPSLSSAAPVEPAGA